jgi:hypothetical protein
MSLRMKQKRMRSLWNRGDMSYADIAARTGRSIAEVAEHLEAQPGYPDLIGNAVPAQCVICGAMYGQSHKLQRYCSDECWGEARRRTWYLHACRKRGAPMDGATPSARQRRSPGLSRQNAADTKIVRAARREAQIRRTTLETVLSAWGFEATRRSP